MFTYSGDATLLLDFYYSSLWYLNKIYCQAPTAGSCPNKLAGPWVISLQFVLITLQFQQGCFLKRFLKIFKYIDLSFLNQSSSFSFTGKDSWCWTTWTNKKLVYYNSASGSKKVNWRWELLGLIYGLWYSHLLQED